MTSKQKGQEAVVRAGTSRERSTIQKNNPFGGTVRQTQTTIPETQGLVQGGPHGIMGPKAASFPLPILLF